MLSMGFWASICRSCTGEFSISFVGSLPLLFTVCLTRASESTSEASNYATVVHSLVQELCRPHKVLVAPVEPVNPFSDDATQAADQGADDTDGTASVHEPSSENVVPELAHLAREAEDTFDDDLTKMFQRDFEDVLFHSAVYSRNANRRDSVTSFCSTLPTKTPSILSNLTLADASIISVVRLPVKIEALTNREAYDVDGEDETVPDSPLNAQTSDPLPAIVFKSTGLSSAAYNKARKIANDLHIPMHASRDVFIHAAMRAAKTRSSRDDRVRLYLCTQSGEYVVQEQERPLLLYAAFDLKGLAPELQLKKTGRRRSRTTNGNSGRAKQDVSNARPSPSSYDRFQSLAFEAMPMSRRPQLSFPTADTPGNVPRFEKRPQEKALFPHAADPVPSRAERHDPSPRAKRSPDGLTWPSTLRGGTKGVQEVRYGAREASRRLKAESTQTGTGEHTPHSPLEGKRRQG